MNATISRALAVERQRDLIAEAKRARGRTPLNAANLADPAAPDDRWSSRACTRPLTKVDHSPATAAPVADGDLAGRRMAKRRLS